jgi:hypothetical protein
MVRKRIAEEKRRYTKENGFNNDNIDINNNPNTECSQPGIPVSDPESGSGFSP